MTLPPLFIVGTSGLAKEVAQLATVLNGQQTARWSSIHYVARTSDEAKLTLPFGTVAGTDNVLEGLQTPAEAVIGIGRPELRRRVATRLSSIPRLFFPNLIHPRATIDPSVVLLGAGNVITCGSIFTCDIRVGDHNIFNLNTTVGHDCVIGSFNVVNPGCNISGWVNLGDQCLLGTGSQVLERLTIASQITIGANALVTRSLSESGIYVGTPAKKR